MAELPKLAELAAPSTRRFAAAVQHVAAHRRVRAGARVVLCHVVHLADPTRSFFKLVCWGDAPPVFRREDHDGDDVAAICVGDIVLFSNCTIKAFRGNVEAQYTRHSSAQLLYRRDRYFNTRDVRLKDLYPMIEWYKTQRHTFLVDGAASGDFSQRPTFTAIADVRESMLVNLRGSIRACKQREVEPGIHAAPANSSEFDGIQLYEVMVHTSPTSAMGLNLWDQFADPRFVARLLAHRGQVDVLGVVVSHNSEANRLLANTTPRTEFQFGTETTDQADSEGDPQDASSERSFATVDALERADIRDGRARLDNVMIEHVVLERFVGHATRVSAASTPLLVECVCAVCDHTLQLEGAQEHAPCKNGCCVHPGQRECKWRYRSVRIVLRDMKQARITVHAGDGVLKCLLGNVDAELLSSSSTPRASIPPFNPREAVASLLNCLVQGGPDPQMYQAELVRVPIEPSESHNTSLLLSMNDSVRHDQEQEKDRTMRFELISLTPIIEYPW